MLHWTFLQRIAVERCVFFTYRNDKAELLVKCNIYKKAHNNSNKNAFQ